MYPTQRFLQIAKERLMIEIDPRSIEETNAIAVEAATQQASTDERAYYEEALQHWSELIQKTQRPNLHDARRSFMKLQSVQNLRRWIKQMQLIDNDAQRLLEQVRRPIELGNNLTEKEALLAEYFNEYESELSDEVDNHNQKSKSLETDKDLHGNDQANPRPNVSPKKRNPSDAKKRPENNDS